MWRDRRLCALLGIEHPIIQAPMAGSTTPALAAAVANAGALGSIGCAEMTPEAFRTAMAATRAATNRPFNMNFFAHTPPRHNPERLARAHALLAPFYAEVGIGAPPDAGSTMLRFDDPMLEAVLETRPAVVSFHFGLPEARLVEAVKATGAVILCTATTPAEARHLEARGVNAVIAQGWEAGGHHGFFLTPETAQLGTLALVPQIVDAVNVPVIAAGGIADGRGIAAALALRAAGVQMGTAFLATAEANVSPARRAAMRAADGSRTRVTRAFTGRPARSLVNRYVAAMAPHEAALPDFPLMDGLSYPLQVAGLAARSTDFAAYLAGQSVGLCREMGAAELVAALVTETRAAIGRIGG